MKLLHSIILGTGNPLLILHGFLGMADNWKTLGAKFSEHGFQVHLIDQRNHGKSFHSEAFNYPVLAEDLVRYISHHQIAPCYLVGHSMGGKTAMFFATAHPEAVSALLVADIAPRYYAPHHQTILEGLQAANSHILTTRNEAETILSGYIPDVATRQFLLKNLYWKEKDKLAFRFHLPALVQNIENLGEALPVTARYQGATLFLKGEYSHYITAEDEPLIKNHFPNARIETIPKAGHWIHAEQPEAFFSTALRFFKNS